MSKFQLMSPVLALFFIACPELESSDEGPGNADTGASLRELCGVNCDTIDSCYGLGVDEAKEDCIDQCVEWRQEDLDRMDSTCDEILMELLECQYNLSCDDYVEYHEEGPGSNHPCIEVFNEYHVTEDCMSGSN
jgi:hypothetical protein